MQVPLNVYVCMKRPYQTTTTPASAYPQQQQQVSGPFERQPFVSLQFTFYYYFFFLFFTSTTRFLLRFSFAFIPWQAFIRIYRPYCQPKRCLLTSFLLKLHFRFVFVFLLFFSDFFISQI